VNNYGSLMLYDYKCESCSEVFEMSQTVSEMESVKESGIPCGSCESGTARRTFSPGNVQFVLKGDGWASKTFREKNYREKRSQEMAVRQREVHGPAPSLVPNYGGEETESWTEAKNKATQDALRNDQKIINTASYDEKIVKAGEKKKLSVAVGGK
jgi:putative FmdB family regulatory protein